MPRKKSDVTEEMIAQEAMEMQEVTGLTDAEQEFTDENNGQDSSETDTAPPFDWEEAEDDSPFDHGGEANESSDETDNGLPFEEESLEEQEDIWEAPVASNTETDGEEAEDFSPEMARKTMSEFSIDSVISEGEPSVQNTRPSRRRRSSAPSEKILTIVPGAEVETLEIRTEVVWHEIHNAYRTRKILTGVLGGLEHSRDGKIIAVVFYKEFRVVIPAEEMMIRLSDGGNYGGMQERQNKILTNMLGAEIDFLILGIDSNSRSIVGSRRKAMLKKRETFYFRLDASGQYRVYEGLVAQARVIAVADKVVRVEVFGVETSIPARNLSWGWVGDAHELYSVGDIILVRVQSINRDSLEGLTIQVDAKSANDNAGRSKQQNFQIQGKYAGTVSDIHGGTIFIKLKMGGIDAVAHSCYDSRTPGKGDEVSFVVTHLDRNSNNPVGFITRITKQAGLK